jgi:hypothetical protein
MAAFNPHAQSAGDGGADKVWRDLRGKFRHEFPCTFDEDITDTFMLARELAPNTLFRGRGMGGDKPIPGNFQGRNTTHSIAGYGITPVLGFWTLRDLHWEFCVFGSVCFGLSSSWLAPPSCGLSLSRSRSGLVFMFQRMKNGELHSHLHWPRGTGSQRHSTAKKQLEAKFLTSTTALAKKISANPPLKYTAGPLKRVRS